MRNKCLGGKDALDEWKEKEEKPNEERGERERDMPMKTMMRFRIPTLAGLAFWEIDDERQGRS